MTAPTLPGDRPSLRTLAPAPLLTAVLAAVAVVGAVAAAPASVRVPLACGAGAGALLLTVAVAVAAHAFQTARTTRRRLEAVTLDAGRLLQDRARQRTEFEQERTRLTDDALTEQARLTTALAEERGRLNRELVDERDRFTQEFAEERDRLTDRYTEENARLMSEYAEERVRLTAEVTRLTAQARQAAHERAAAVAATANAAGRMQALSTGMLADLRAMEERHDDPAVLTDLLHLDHRTAQAGRLADSVAVLAGARSGRRWARPIAMESILRGAMGRISGYQRVRVHSASEAAVAGHAAEGVMHALAELLDNAANFSPPTAEVHVYVEEVPAGVIVSVEDSGLVMGEVQLRRAEKAVSGEGEGLGGLTGTRLGLAVVGRLARRYGLKVSYRPSARGGTGVLLLVPQDILVADPYAKRPATPDTLAALPGTPAADGARPPAPDAGTPEPSDAASGTVDDEHATADAAPDPVPAHGAPDRAAVPAPDGLTGRFPDPLSERPAAALPDGLPKRRRGRALAQAEREREKARARVRADDYTPPAGEAPAAAQDDPPTRAARFSSFRKAVRGSLSDQGDPTGTTATDTATDTAPPRPSTADEPAGTPAPATADTPSSHPHPEGDPTS
ncbi:ATP-binding protein [Streptomyces sp. NPDC090106]|uniref:ATP-binding protein n=1 Tax=Streptomyces sp. NPDC090106 TaxID=3365946 RepID=UPI003805EFF6